MAWVLNFDAEEELAVPRRYQPTAAMLAVLARQRARLVEESARGRSFLAPGDLIVDERTPPGAAAGLEGRAWCPTPRAVGLLERAGATPRGVLDVDVLRRVNARPFAAELRERLEGPAFEKRIASDLDEALSLVARPAALGWLVRRTFGAAGRGRRRLAAGRVEGPDRAWLAASLARGPVVVEPWADVVEELTVCGAVTASGNVQVLTPGFQLTTRQGAWTRTDAADPNHLGRADDSTVLAACNEVGRALAAAGYRGPFGIDAFRHRPAPGAAPHLNVLSEINARLTMDRIESVGSDNR
ncbi:hypothetical protein Pla86_19040 [Planctomycetes bacterium Pla86]|uniref:ATP-grasp domain-containing protein n=1 Tax=Engelhardtia mirabilis TaxID=2528011 RepID=A0A518BIM3_9BACT|nr:hypothetical protein Pla133_19050 [Planctomycetes bacterium Pla133]QDV01155.1 hypothetical protein Pla86_19040 [Planctomycetes bacterium Pla86]